MRDEHLDQQLILATPNDHVRDNIPQRSLKARLVEAIGARLEREQGFAGQRCRDFWQQELPAFVEHLFGELVEGALKRMSARHFAMVRKMRRFLQPLPGHEPVLAPRADASAGKA